jgi:hypothetical protein
MDLHLSPSSSLAIVTGLVVAFNVSGSNLVPLQRREKAATLARRGLMPSPEHRFVDLVQSPNSSLMA